MVKQRPEVVLPAASQCHASEKISDPAAIAALLSSCSAMADENEDDLIFELLYLETLLASHPLKSGELLAELGALGDEVRDGLLPPGVVDMMAIRRRTRRLRQQMGVTAGRITAALLVLLTSLPFFGQEAEAAKPGPEGKSFQLAQAPVVRVVDANSGAGVAGVQIKSMEEKLLGVTDATGQATLSEEYMETDLLSLEKDGYQMYLLDRTQLSTRNIVSMKPLKDGDSATALLQKAPTPPKAPEGPKVAHGDGHHAPHVTPPKPPTPPKAPQVKLPVRPKAPKQDAHAAPKPEHPAPKHEAPKPAEHHAAAPKHEAVKPLEHHAAKPAEHLAPAAKHDDHGADSHPMAQPAKPRAPMAAAHGHDDGHHADSVSVPKRVPTPKVEHMEEAHAPTSSDTYYKVRTGDTLSALAKRHLGSAKRWPEIFEANRDKLKNPHWIQVGQELTIPVAAAAKAAPRDVSKTHVVKRGETLSGIAGAYMGDMSKWHSIYAANRSHIRNPHVIYPGQRLVIPG